MWSKRFISLLVSLASILVFLCFASVISGTRAQEVFNSQGNQNTGGDVFAGQGNPNCPPPVINGVTPKTWTCTTGTQGVTGNPFCPPPVIIINGVPTTPKNWSCPGTGPQGPGRAPPAPIGATACLPFGKGGYDYCANPAGTRLPAGCDCTKQRADANPLPPRLSGYADSHGDVRNKDGSSPEGAGNKIPGTPDAGVPPVLLPTNGGPLTGAIEQVAPPVLTGNTEKSAHPELAGSTEQFGPKLDISIVAGWPDNHEVKGTLPSRKDKKGKIIPNYYGEARGTVGVVKDAQGQVVKDQLGNPKYYFNLRSLTLNGRKENSSQGAGEN